MKKSIAKVLSIVLVLVMVVSAMPVSAMSGISDGSGRGIRDWWRDLWKWWVKPTPIEVIDYPAQQLEAELAGGVTVTVEAPKGALPAKTRMSAVSIDKLSAVQAAVDSAEDVSGTVLTAVDITFYNGNSEVQPRKDVQVTITSDALSGMDNLSVVHLDVSAENLGPNSDAEPVDDVETGDESVVFNARHFSVYAVIGGGDEDNAILTVKFLDMDGETVINVQKIRKARIPEMDPVVYDPGVPSLGSNQAFTGWGVTVPGDTYTTANSASVEQIEDYILQNYQSWTTEEQLTLTYIAQVFDVTFVFYCDQYGAIFKTETVAVGAEFTYDNSYVADGPSGTTTGLVGWLDYTNVQNSNVDSVGVGNELPHYKSGAADEAGTRAPGSKGVANGEIVLFPYVAGGHWITFESNITYNGNTDPTRATFTAPRFVADGAYASPVDDPVREGYTFGGWYTDANCTTKFNFRNESNPTAVNGNITLYAKWTPKTVSYKIVYWTQNRNDEVGLANNAKTWDYYVPTTSGVVVEGTATAGSSFTLTSASSGKTAYNRLGRNSEDYSGLSSNGELGYYFKLNNTKTEKTKLIKGDGTTVFNVYYDRAALTFNFYSTNSYTSDNLLRTYTGLYEHDFGGYPQFSSSGYCWKYYDTNVSKTYILTDGTAPSVFKPFLLCSETWNIYADDVTTYTYNPEIRYMLQDLDGSYYVFRTGTLGCNGTTSSSSYETMYIGGYEFFGFTGVGYNERTNSTSGSYYHTFTASDDKDAYVFNAYNIVNYGTYIYYQRNQWKLDFYSNGTKLTDLSDTVYFDKPLSGYQPSASYVPANAPVGHYFTGWYKDPECTEPFDWSGKMPNNDMAVYAGWSTEWYRVVFQAYNENVPESAIIVRGGNQALSFCMEYGKKIGAGSLANLECSIPGYTFGGWFYDEECTMPFSFDTEIGPNLPDASHNKMDMTYKDWSDSDRQGTYSYNTVNSQNQLVPQSGSWSDVSDATHDNSGVRGYLKLYGLWRKKVAGAAGISVIYDAIEDKGIIRAPYPAEVVKPDPLVYTDGAVAFGRYAATPINADGEDDEDRQFLYWEIKDKQGNVLYKVYPGQPFPINIDWAEEVNAYTITWEYKKPDGSPTSDTTKVAEGTMPHHSNPSSYQIGDKNYVFTGWQPELVYATENATYTAQYEEREAVHFTVTFVHNGTTETQQVVEGAYPTVPASVSVPSGKRFIGWYMNDGTTLMSNEQVASTAITAATTFSAQYEDAGYTVTFDANGGYFAADNSTTKVYQNVEAGTKLSDLFPSANPVNDNTVDVNGEAEALSFYAWFTSGTGGTEIDSETVTGDVTVYAHWATRSWEYDNTGTFVVGDMYSFDIMNSSSSQGSGYSLGVGTPGSYLKRSTTTSTVTSDQQWTVFQGNTGTLLANASNGSYYYIYSNDGEGYTSTSQAVAISLASAGTATYNNSSVSVYYLKSGTAYLNYTASSSYTSWFIWSNTATTKYIVWHYEVVDQNASSKGIEEHSSHAKQIADERTEVIVPGDEKRTNAARPTEEKRARVSEGRNGSVMPMATNTLLTENFDSMSSISTTYSGTGWYAYKAGSGNNWTLNSSSTYAHSGSKSAQVEYSSSAAANCYLVSAPFTVSANATALTLSLYERVRGESYAETFEAFFVKANDVTSAAGVASATKYQALASASYTNTTYAEKTGSVQNVSALAGESVRLVIHCTSAADKYYLYIDDVTVTETTGGSSSGGETGSELWVPVNTVEAGETYLIGYTDSDTGVTYLMMNYNPAAQAYYTSASLSGYTADRECYAIVAIKDGNGNVTGVDTSSISGATLDHVKWTFNAVSGSTAYNIQSVHNSSYYLRIQNTTDTNLRLYPAALTTNYSNWNWDSSNRYLSATYSGVTKYVAVLTSSSTGAVTCFDADSDVDYAIGLQLYKKQAVEPTPTPTPGSDVQYVLVDQPVNGVSYIMVIQESISGSTGYAVSNANKSGSTDTGTSYVLGEAVNVSGDTVTIPESSVSALTWLASGSAASGFTWKNPGTNKYLALTSANYLTAESSASLVWQYDASKNMTQAQDTEYPYLGYGSTGAGATNYTVSKNAGAVNLYAKAHTLTVNYVFANGGTASETYTAVLGEGTAYSVESPVIAGFSADAETVSGTIGDGDVTVNVTYTQQASTVYTVTYMANGRQVDAVTVVGGDNTTTLTNVTAPSGYTFAGWVSTQIPDETTSVPTYYAAGASYGPVNSDVTLYALFTRSEGGTGTAYELVTSALTDWSGNYVITYGTDTDMYVMKGVTPDSDGSSIESASNRSTYDDSGITLEGTRLTGVADTYVFTMQARGSYYRVQSVATGAYLGLTNSSGLLAGYTSYSSTYCRWTPGVGDNASSMQNAYSSASYPYLSFSTNSNYFWSGSSANTGVRLWKETTDSTTYYTTSTEEVYALTINFVVPEGFDAIPAQTYYYAENEEYSIEVPEIAHCTPNVTAVAGTMGNEDKTVTVTYSEDPKHTVTVHYTGIEGYVLPDAVVTVYEGESYTIGSPYYYGYVADPATVSGVMGTEDVSFTVTYTATQEQGDKTYTITLYAVYGRANKTGNTHIYWYTNDDAASEISGGDRQADIAEINTAVDIPTPTSFKVNTTIDHTNTNGGSKDGETGFDWADHVFLGWARVEDPTNADETGKKHPELNEDDLYLKWTGSGYQVETKNGWVDVTQVAADEMRPYHDMYAVWADVFYVYHSGDNSVERIVRTTKAGTYDLTANLASDTLYGGYYADYAGKSMDFGIVAARAMGWNANITADSLANSQYKETKSDTGANATEYNGVNKTWNGTEAYLTNGQELTPKAGEIYYIKEVPADKYLRPYLHYTYYGTMGENNEIVGSGKIASLFAISDIDDMLYFETGFVIAAKHNAHVVKSLSVNAQNTDTTVTLTADKLFGVGKASETANRLTYLKIFDEGQADNIVGFGENFTVARYWKTPDGLYVTGVTRTAYTGTGNAGSIAAADSGMTSVIKSDLNEFVSAVTGN